MKEFLPYAALAVSVVACLVSILTFIRVGRWRLDEAQAALAGRVRDLESKTELMEQKVQALEEDVQNLPTRADFARLEGEIKTTCKIADRTEQSVKRIEGFLMERRP